jgi:hypothetical protein
LLQALTLFTSLLMKMWTGPGDGAPLIAAEHNLRNSELLQSCTGRLREIVSRTVHDAIAAHFQRELGGFLGSATGLEIGDDAAAIGLRFVDRWQALLQHDLVHSWRVFEPYMDGCGVPHTVACWVQCMRQALREESQKSSRAHGPTGQAPYHPWLLGLISSAQGFLDRWSADSTRPMPPRLDMHISDWVLRARIFGAAVSCHVKRWVRSARFEELHSMFAPMASLPFDPSSVPAPPYEITRLQARSRGCESLNLDDFFVCRGGMSAADGVCCWDTTVTFGIVRGSSQSQCPCKVVHRSCQPAYVLCGQPRRLRVSVRVHTPGFIPILLDDLVVGDVAFYTPHLIDDTARARAFDSTTARSCDERTVSCPVACSKDDDDSLVAEFAWPSHVNPRPTGTSELCLISAYLNLVASVMTDGKCTKLSWPLKAQLAAHTFPLDSASRKGQLHFEHASAMACPDAVCSVRYRIFCRA